MYLVVEGMWSGVGLNHQHQSTNLSNDSLWFSLIFLEVVLSMNEQQFDFKFETETQLLSEIMRNSRKLHIVLIFEPLLS